MKLLHIGAINNTSLTGMGVAVPMHVIACSPYSKVNFFNNSQIQINSLDLYQIHQIDYSKYDAVFFHGIYFKNYVAISKNLRANKIPYFVVAHGCLTKKAIRYKFLKKLTALYSCFYSFWRQSSGIVYLSDEEKEKTSRMFSKIPAYITGNGISPAVEVKQHFSTGMHLVYIGRINYKIKGLDLLLKAMDIVRSDSNINDLSLDIIGPASKRDLNLVNSLIKKKGLNGIVHVHDAVLGDEKRKQLLEHDIFIQTSRTEGMPMGVIEAMSYGLPVIVTNGTTLGELVANNNLGWNCNTDFESIASAIEKAYSDKDTWAEVSSRSVRYINESLTWDSIGKKYMSIVNSVYKRQEVCEKQCT